MICRTEAERRALTRVKCAVLKISHRFDALSKNARKMHKAVRALANLIEEKTRKEKL